MQKYWRPLGLSQKLALVAGGLCLACALTLVVVSDFSSRYILQQQRDEHGHSLAQQVAQLASGALLRNDLISLEASLLQLVQNSSADQVVVYDLEEHAIGSAGKHSGNAYHRYRAAVRVHGDLAGHAEARLSEEGLLAQQRSLMLGLLGLALMLSIFSYAVSAHLAQRLAAGVNAMLEQLRTDETSQNGPPGDELAQLQQQLAQLPLELLRTASEQPAAPMDDEPAAILYLHLDSLASYVERLDQDSLLRYTRSLQHLVAHAANFYGGRLGVVRQFGLAVIFSGVHNTGTAALRASSTAWLIRATAQALQQQTSLRINLSMGVAMSALGVGSEADIYSGLYLQHVIDELQGVIGTEDDGILLSADTAADEVLSQRISCGEAEAEHWCILGGFTPPFDELLQRQVELLRSNLTRSAEG